MPTKKLDLLKQLKDEYITPKSPALVTVKKGSYLTIIGKGAPAGEAFTAAVGALYSVAYTLKFMKKKAGVDYKVMQLEGLWWTEKKVKDFSLMAPDDWCWKMLVRSPDFLTQSDLKQAKKQIAEKKAKECPFDEVMLEKIYEGVCVQLLHIGPYAEERENIERMHAFATEQGYKVRGLHHEIYLSDPHRVPPSKLKTILRLPVEKKSGKK